MPTRTNATSALLDRDAVIAICRARTRRRWLLRAATSLTLSAIILVVMICIRRDRTTVDEALRQISRPIPALQAAIDRLEQLPAVLPGAAPRTNLTYASDLVREYARQATGPIIVASTPPQELIFQGRGNAVMIYEAGKVRSEWWPRGEFLRQCWLQSARIREWDEQRHAALPELP